MKVSIQTYDKDNAVAKAISSFTDEFEGKVAKQVKEKNNGNELQKKCVHQRRAINQK